MDERTAVAADAEPYVDMPADERARHLVAVCRLTADLLRSRPDAERVLATQEPPHPDWAALIRRYRG